ncbi:MAG: mannitol dehydrogenase family protein, partial [Natronospirillum sp.]
MRTIQDAYQAEIAADSTSGYDRNQLMPAIAHIGVGGFHRAHQAWYLERYNRRLTPESTDRGWGIVGIGLLPNDGPFLQKMQEQNGLYSLTLADQDQQETTVLGSIIKVIAAADDSQRAIDQLADPAIRIISTTITEGGYLFDFESNRFIADHPLVRNDLDLNRAPQSIFGYLSRALRQRCDSAAGPVTLMSCDNVPGNGEVLQKALTAFLQLSGDQKLLQWVSQNVSFPNSMVDRKTPTPSAQLADDVAKRTGVQDKCPVLGEPFAQWVIEDDFIAGRPALESVGVEFTPHVENFEQLKLRILNGTHILVSLIGRLQGLTYIHETLAD